MPFRYGPRLLGKDAMTPLWRLRSWWSGYQTTVMRIAVAMLCTVALLNLAHKFHRAVWSPIGSGDLRYRYEEVRHWFAGRPLAAHVEQVYYPPASYPMLWPFLGWPSLPTARLLWALTVLAMLLWLSALVVRASGAEAPVERAFMAVVPLAMNAAGFTLGIGQLSAHVLALLLAGLLLLTRPRLAWRDDIWMALLFLAALVKPTVAAPFFWIVLFARGTLRPAWLIGVGYVAVTLMAMAFQPWTWGTLVGWVSRGAQSGTMWGYAHVPGLLEALGLETWMLPTSGLLLAGLGWWVYRHRDGDLWLLLGVTALVARVWTYHLSYDDPLILLPLVALFRLAKHAPPGRAAGAWWRGCCWRSPS
jgi:hypothetical protein